MYFFTKLFISTILIQLVLTQKFLFNSANLNIKNHKSKTIKNQLYRRVSVIDQHNFAKAVRILVQTNKMKVYEGAVKNLPLLQSLSLKKCGIEHLPPKTFMNLPRLQTLRLHENKLTFIGVGVFNYLPVQKLWLQKNKIARIESAAFDHMFNLEVIHLNSNRLSVWDSKWFYRSPKVSQLFFRRNYLSEIPKKAFVNIKGSHKINDEELVDTQIFLSSNKISYIHPEAFSGLDSLDQLNLRNNTLEKIDWNMFSHMSELHNLTLRTNQLSKIDADAFENVNEVLELDLSRNHFECIPYKIAAKVKKVNLSQNREMSCDCLSNLQEKLAENKVENEIIALVRNENKCDS